MRTRVLPATPTIERLQRRHARVRGAIRVPDGWARQVDALLTATRGASIEVTYVGERNGGLWVLWTGHDAEAEALLEEAVSASRSWPR